MPETEQTSSQAESPAIPRVWDTNEVARGEAFAYYREGICAAFMPLRPELGREMHATFNAQLHSYKISDSVLNVVSARAHDVLRTRAQISASATDCYYLNYQIDGDCRVNQLGSEIVLAPGAVGIFDGGEPFALGHERQPSLKVLSVMLQKKTLLEKHGVAVALQQQRLSNHVVYGALIRETMRTIADGIGWMRVVDVAILQEQLISLVVSSCRSRGYEVSASRSVAQLLRAKSIVRQRCRDPEFSIADCASEMGLSARYVHKLFASEQERFSVYLLRERVKVAARFLLDPAMRHLPASAIAMESGFNDPSHFSRVFRGHFGEPPALWRSRSR